MNTCHDTTIKDLLPAYREQALDQPDMDRVRKHLESCEDCRGELDLLEVLAADSVPDPGEAFWAAMPSRVYRSVHEEKERKGHAGLSRLLDRFILPRWAWTAAAACVVLLVTWVAIHPQLKQPGRAPSPGYEDSEETMPVYPSPPEPVQIQISELDNDELDTAADWAGNELASISREIDQGMVNGPDTDLYAELRQLDAGEVDQLSRIIDQWNQEEG